MQFPGMTIEHNGQAVTLVHYIGRAGGSFRWQAEDAQGFPLTVELAA